MAAISFPHSLPGCMLAFCRPRGVGWAPGIWTAGESCSVCLPEPLFNSQTQSAWQDSDTSAASTQLAPLCSAGRTWPACQLLNIRVQHSTQCANVFLSTLAPFRPEECPGTLLGRPMRDEKSGMVKTVRTHITLTFYNPCFAPSLCVCLLYLTFSIHHFLHLYQSTPFHPDMLF